MFATRVIIINDIENKCRICLSKFDCLKMRPITDNLHPSEKLEAHIFTINDELKRVFVILDNEGYLPPWICFKCVEQLHSAYKFKLLYEESIGIVTAYHENIEQLKRIPDSSYIVAKVNSEEPEEVYYNEISTIPNKKTTKVNLKHQKKIYPVREHNSFRRITVENTKRKFACPMCREFFDETDLTIHMNSHADLKEYVEDALHKIESKTYPCSICCQRFTAIDLRDHIHSHRSLKRYLNIPKTYLVKPTARFYKTQSKENLNSNENGEKLHTCGLCGTSHTTSEFKYHIPSHKNLEFQCDLCGRVFRKLSSLTLHNIQHLKEYPYQCAICGKCFIIEANYNCHLLIHEKRTEELPHPCSYCDKRFSNIEHMKRHTLIHTEDITYGQKYRVFRCMRCRKTFKTQYLLKAHRLTYCEPVEVLSRKTHVYKTKEIIGGSYPCQTCDKVFQTKNCLYKHNYIKHRPIDKLPLCSICGIHTRSMARHMYAVHRADSNGRPAVENPFACTQCPKMFTTAQRFKQHMLVHSGLKPYECSFCSKAFNSLNNLQVHERIHKGNKCHECTDCGKGFLEKSYLKKHLKIHEERK